MPPATDRGQPEALAFRTDNCQVERAMALLGQPSTIVVLREVFNGIRRFDDMRRHAGVSRQVLSDRLGVLVEHGVLRREPYQDPGQRERYEYRLTPKGFDLYPFLTAVAAWGTAYYADDDGAAVEMVHRGCGGRVHARLACECGRVLDDPRSVAPAPGPGARREPGE